MHHRISIRETFINNIIQKDLLTSYHKHKLQYIQQYTTVLLQYIPAVHTELFLFHTSSLKTFLQATVQVILQEIFVLEVVPRQLRVQ